MGFLPAVSKPNQKPHRNLTKESSISVTVRVRPFTEHERSFLINSDNEPFFLGEGSFSSNGTQEMARRSAVLTPKGIRKIINVVDDKMLIFDPPETNPLIKMQRDAFPNSNMTSRIREHRFVFDQLFDDSAEQEDVYVSTTRPLLDCVLDGYNATAFAYGATGCGKTYTILGTPENPGIIFLTMKELYKRIDELSDSKTIEVSLSFLEIYNETIRDLLNPETDHKKLCLREDSTNRISVPNLLTHSPKSVDEVMNLILIGNQNRTSSPTEANATSSRSHAVLQINVIQKNRTADINETHTFATLSIIDLAGSERAASTRNKGIRLNEGANINRSLLALGNCINALCDPRRRNHIPYRDSKLTRLLKFSLGGNCKTVMIVCISPLSQHYDETLNTLKYADRAKQIKTKLHRNQHNLDRHVGSYLKMITEQKQEIEELRTREACIVESTISKNNLVNERCLSILLESIESIRESIDKQSQEKWKKYFILAKRKIILIQKKEAESLTNSFYRISQVNNSKEINTILGLLEQFFSKIKFQITDLENRYNQPCQIDHILNDSSRYSLKRHTEVEGWNKHHTLIFESSIGHLKDSLQREILFNSSILFDYIIHELKLFGCLSEKIMDIISNGIEFETQQPIFDEFIISLEKMVNGEFDSELEQCASIFMQKKLKEQEELENLDNNLMDLNSNTNHRYRESKRGPISPLKSSPPRSVKKTIIKKPATPQFSTKESKKVRWEVPNDLMIGESDISVDDSTFQNMSSIKNDFESLSPQQNILHQKNFLPDDLDLTFDPTLDSPPLNKVSSSLPQQKEVRNPRLGSFSNKRLSVNLNRFNQPTKLPLLNKLASTKVVSTDTSKDTENTGITSLSTLAS